jgi:hypothetical protein
MEPAREGALVPQELFEHSLQFGYPGGGDVPDFVEVHPYVVVDQHVAHTTDCLPIE